MNRPAARNANDLPRAKGGSATVLAPLALGALAMLLLSQPSRAVSSEVYGEPITGTDGEATTVSGSLDKEGIRRVIHQHRAALRTCYQHALRTSPTLEGKVTVKFVIGRNGRVISAAPAMNTTLSAALAECIVGNVRTWVFPPAGRDVVSVTYPFIFRPMEPADGGAVGHSNPPGDAGR